jgi:hypothetical protein
MKKIKVKEIKSRRWTLYLYYNGVLIKKKKIAPGEEPANNNYVVNVYFKKKLFGSNIAGVIVKPVRLLRNDEKSRKTYWGTTLETGIDV